MKCNATVRAVVGILLISGAPISTLQDSSEVMDFGPVSVRLGMTRQTAISRLSESYDVVAWPNGPIAVMTKDRRDTVGSIFFDDKGLLSSITRGWGPANQQAGVETVENLYAALIQVTKPTPSGHRYCNCIVEIIDAPNPRVNSKDIHIVNGVREISLTVGRVQNVDRSSDAFVTITESLERPK